MAVGDYCDQNNYVVDYLDFSNNPEQITQYVKSVRATSGGKIIIIIINNI